MKVTRLFTDFFESEKSGGMILVAATICSLLLANSAFGAQYIAIWETPLGSHSVTQWINDGLMAIFFLLIGLELEREIYIGELSDLRKAALPVFGAIGGMLVPAGIFLALNFGTPTQSGAGIPVATDIAFAVGILSLLGKRVPVALKVFLTALAVIDDLGAIIIIAIFYTKSIAFTNLAASLGILAVLLILNRLKIRNLIIYLVGGIAMWYFMLQSGVHSTIAGVLLAFAIPFGNGNKNSTSFILQHFLHKPVAVLILPLFALANTCVVIPQSWGSSLSLNHNLGIMAGLIFGKPLGILAFASLAATIGICTLPKGVSWKQILGVGMLGGIGFTMSIFIAMLAFSDTSAISQAKIAILIASLVSAVAGFVFLKMTLKKKSGN